MGQSCGCGNDQNINDHQINAYEDKQKTIEKQDVKKLDDINFSIATCNTNYVTTNQE